VNSANTIHLQRRTRFLLFKLQTLLDLPRLTSESSGTSCRQHNKK
jgi:hypothetical protein